MKSPNWNVVGLELGEQQSDVPGPLYSSCTCNPRRTWPSCCRKGRRRRRGSKPTARLLHNPWGPAFGDPPWFWSFFYVSVSFLSCPLSCFPVLGLPNPWSEHWDPRCVQRHPEVAEGPKSLKAPRRRFLKPTQSQRKGVCYFGGSFRLGLPSLCYVS